MKMIEPNGSRLPQALALIPPNTPITVINLLKFNQQTNYPDGAEHENCAGDKAYNERYLQHAKQKISEVGGNILYDGAVYAEMIGETTNYWNRVLLIRYPSIANFMKMVSTPEYQELRVHRAAALDDSRLTATVANE